MKTIDDAFIKGNRPLFRHKKCVFIVGAGISVASGIPDFRSPDGIFSSLRRQLRVDGRQLFTHNFGIKEGTRGIYLRYISDLKKLCESSNPNSVHRFLAGYPRSRTYTQNIDGLEERAGMPFTRSDDTKGVYLHGNLALLSCRYCGYRRSFTQSETEAFSEGKDVQCTLCLERREACLRNNTRKRPVGDMHPGIVHYQQLHPDGAFIGRMVEKDRDCDLLVVIGTSLKVEGVRKMVRMFSRCQSVGGKRILVNLTKPSKEWEDVFDYFYEGDCSDFVGAVERLVPCAEAGLRKSARSEPQTVEGSAESVPEPHALKKDVPVEISLRRISISKMHDGRPSEEHGVLDKLERLSDTLDDAEAASRSVLKEEAHSTGGTGAHERDGTPGPGQTAADQAPKGRYKRKAARRQQGPEKEGRCSQ